MQEMKPQEKIRYVIENIAKGRELDVIAIELGYKNHKSLDMFMRREGYLKDRNAGNYYPKNGKGYIPQEMLEEDACVPVKALEVIQHFKEKKHTPKQIAANAGFKDIKEMAVYMKSRGFIWDVERNNYVLEKQEHETLEEDNIHEEAENKEYAITDMCDGIKEGEEKPNASISKYLNLLEYLYERKDKLAGILDEEYANKASCSIPRYIIQGIYITKSLHMNSQLDKMIKDYSTEKGIQQKDIFEIALVEFFMKYGYDRKIRVLLGNE